MLMNLMLHSLSHSEKEISETAQLKQLEPYIAILREMANPVLRGPVSSRTSTTSTKSASAQEELAQAQEPVSGLLTAITALTALLAPSIPVLIRGDKEELAQEQQLQQLGPTTRAILGLMAGGDQAEAEVEFPRCFTIPTSLVNRRPILSRSVLSRLTPTIAKFYNEAVYSRRARTSSARPCYSCTYYIRCYYSWFIFASYWRKNPEWKIDSDNIIYYTE